MLVHAAAGGVGLWLCQILKAIGARTIGTASTAEKIKLATENGADYMIDYSKDSVPEKVREIVGSGGVRVVFDGVGKSTFEGSMEAVGRKGSMISFGNASGAVPPVTIAYISLSPSSFFCECTCLDSNSLTQASICEERQTGASHIIQLHLHETGIRALRQRAVRDDEQGQDECPHP